MAVIDPSPAMNPLSLTLPSPSAAEQADRRSTASKTIAGADRRTSRSPVMGSASLPPVKVTWWSGQKMMNRHVQD
jgi:hypothetical protein